MNEVTNGVYVIKYNPGREQNYTIWKDKQVVKFVSWYKLPIWAKEAFKMCKGDSDGKEAY